MVLRELRRGGAVGWTNGCHWFCCRERKRLRGADACGAAATKVLLFWFALSIRTRSGSKCRNVFCDGGERRLKMVVVLARVSAAMTDCGESCCSADGARDGGAWC